MPRVSNWRKKQAGGRGERRAYTSFCNLNSDMTSHYSCRILLIRRGPAQVHGEGISQGHENQEAEALGASLRLPATASKI